MNVLQPYSNVIREVFKSTCGRFYDYSLDFAISLENITFLPFYEPQPVKRCIKNTPLFWLEGKIYLLSAGFWMCKNKHADLYKKGGWLNDRVCVASTKQEYQWNILFW